MSDITYVNHKQALLDLCLRNALLFAIGEIKYTKALGDQIQFAIENSNKNTREILKKVFDIE